MKKVILSLFSAAFALTAFAACSKADDGEIVNLKTYVLVHGAWQAPYVWDGVRQDLTEKGHQVIVVELPGHGADHTPPYQLSLDVYRDKVIEAISKAKGEVILVGHSMAGMVVSAVAEKVPNRISKVVYIGAFLPTSGQSLGELAQSDPDSQLGRSLIESPDHLTIDVNRENLTRLFIADGSQAAKDKVVTYYRPEPAIPLGNTVTLTPSGFGSVQKVYIKTLQDIVISPKLQDRMIAAAGITQVYEIGSSHSPFLSQPHAISDLLLKISR